jgi:hypothetical protein
MKKHYNKIIFLFIISFFYTHSGLSQRARDLGVKLNGKPGAFNAITDVQGVLVGHSTIIKGQGKLRVGQGSVRTGVTAIFPKGKTYDPLFCRLVFAKWKWRNEGYDLGRRIRIPGEPNSSYKHS